MNRTLLALLLTGVAASSQAVTTGVLAPNASAGRAARISTSPGAATANADDSSGLRKGTIEAVDLAGGTFKVFGQTMNFNAAKLRIFGRDGKATTVYALVRGAKVRFTLDPVDATHRSVAVVYVE